MPWTCPSAEHCHLQVCSHEILSPLHSGKGSCSLWYRVQTLVCRQLATEAMLAGGIVTCGLHLSTLLVVLMHAHAPVRPCIGDLCVLGMV